MKMFRWLSHERPANGAQARVVVHNPKRVPVKNLTVKILSLVPIHSKERLRRKSAQFPGMPLRIERGQQGMELAGHGFVEVWVVQHAKGDDKLVRLRGLIMLMSESIC